MLVNDFKDKGDYQPHEAGMFTDGYSNQNFISSIIINVQSNADAAFEEKLFKSLSDAIGSSIEIRHLTEQRTAINKVTLFQ